MTTRLEIVLLVIFVIILTYALFESYQRQAYFKWIKNHENKGMYSFY
jgi:hypothetical protein